MIKKIMSVLEIVLMCALAFFAGLGLMFFINAMTKISENSKKTEEIPCNISYTKYDIDDDRIKSLLVISGDGIVLKEVVDMFEDIDAIYVCKSISGIEPNAFRDVEELKLLVMSADIDSADNKLPMYTDLYYIEDCFYEFLDMYT